MDETTEVEALRQQLADAQAEIERLRQKIQQLEQRPAQVTYTVG